VDDGVFGILGFDHLLSQRGCAGREGWCGWSTKTLMIVLVE